MRKFLTLFAMLAFVSVVHAQNQIGLNIADHLLIKNSNRNLDGDAEKIEGSSYLSDQFTPGVVHGIKGKFVPTPLRYDIFNDVLEFQQNGLVYILDPSTGIKKVEMGENILVVRQINFKGPHLGYLLLLDSGKVSLLQKKVIKFMQGKPPAALQSTATPAKYLPGQDVYYYQINKALPAELRSLKEMIADFPDKHDEMNAYVKKEKISAKKKEDLIQLVKYYNSL
jgi:hypothetical protein